MKSAKVLSIEYAMKILDYNTNEVIENFHYPWINEVNYPIIPNVGDTITSFARKGKVKKVEREIEILTDHENDYITVYIELIKINDIKHGL